MRKLHHPQKPRHTWERCSKNTRFVGLWGTFCPCAKIAKTEWVPPYDLTSFYAKDSKLCALGIVYCYTFAKWYTACCFSFYLFIEPSRGADWNFGMMSCNDPWRPSSTEHYWMSVHMSCINMYPMYDYIICHFALSPEQIDWCGYWQDCTWSPLPSTLFLQLEFSPTTNNTLVIISITKTYLCTHLILYSTLVVLLLSFPRLRSNILLTTCIISYFKGRIKSRVILFARPQSALQNYVVLRPQ